MVILIPFVIIFGAIVIASVIYNYFQLKKQKITLFDTYINTYGHNINYSEIVSIKLVRQVDIDPSGPALTTWEPLLEIGYTHTGKTEKLYFDINYTTKAWYYFDWSVGQPVTKDLLKKLVSKISDKIDKSVLAFISEKSITMDSLEEVSNIWIIGKPQGVIKSNESEPLKT